MKMETAAKSHKCFTMCQYKKEQPKNRRYSLQFLQRFDCFDVKQKMLSPNLKWLPSNLAIKLITWIRYVVTQLHLHARIRISNKKISIVAYFFCAGNSTNFTYLNTMVWLENKFNCQLPVKDRKIFYLAKLSLLFFNIKYSQLLHFLNA